MKVARVFSVALLAGMFMVVPAKANGLGDAAQNTTALAIVNHYIRLGCQDPAAYELRADILQAMGKTREAEADYRKAAALIQENFDRHAPEVAKAP